MTKRHTVLMALFINSVFLVILFSLSVQSEAPPEMPLAHHVEDMLIPSNPTLDAPALLDTLPEMPVSAQVTEPTFPPVISPEPEVVELPEEKPQLELIELFVKRGDNLSKLGQRYGVTVQEIIRINQLSSTNLKIGQKLRVPKVAQVKAPEKEEYYTIQKGDNLWLIASKYKVKVKDLMKFNQLDDAKAKKLRAGDQIRIR